MSSYSKIFNNVIVLPLQATNYKPQVRQKSEKAPCYYVLAESFLTPFLNKKFWEELIAYFPWCDTGHIENDASNNSSIVACLFVTAVTFLPKRCLATIRGFLPSRCLATIGGLLPSRCLATIGGLHRHTLRQQRDLIILLSLFQNKERRLKMSETLPLLSLSLSPANK
jgi:hypothetical protein